MLFQNQLNSSSGSLSCSSFSIRRSQKVQPHSQSEDLTGEGLRGVEEKVGAADNMACEKINTSSNSDQGNHDITASTMDNKKMPLQPKIQAATTTTATRADSQSIFSHTSAMTPFASINRSELREFSSSSEAEPSDSAFSCEDLTESSYDGLDVPDLVDEDCVVEISPRRSPLFFNACSQVRESVHRLAGISLHTYSSSSSRPLSPTLKPAIKPSLKPKKQLPHAGRPSTARRVRGLWSNTVNDDCHWNKLRDETVSHVLNFLNLAEILKVGMVSKRYQSLVHSNKTLWFAVDGTEFVQTSFTNFLSSSKSVAAAQERTGNALEDVLRRYKPISLTIRQIHSCLSANSYLPSVASLQELTLTHFDDLTDTHAHVLLLMTQSGTKKKPNALRKLALNHCPRLTNASLRSVASQCASLESLSLYGCSGITNLEPLATLLASETKHLNLAGTAALQPSYQATSALMKMFAPPQGTAGSSQSSRLSKMFTPNSVTTTISDSSNLSTNLFKQPSPSDQAIMASQSPPSSPPRLLSPAPASSLRNLFAPPGLSPPRSGTPSLHSSTLQAKAPGIAILKGCGSTRMSGKLQELDLRGTSVKPSAILKLFSIASDENCLNISLQTLLLDGNQWTDGHLDRLGGMLAWNELTHLSFSCVDNHHFKAGVITDDALVRLAEGARFSRLTQLDLSGQQSITGRGLASLLQQSPNLQSLICRGTSKIWTTTSIVLLTKRLHMLRKKKSLRLLDIRDCELEPMVEDLVKSTLSDKFSPPVQLLL